ncbi:MAG TPA: hypothetical protein VF972_05725 [Actinomycetota bacterium]
MQDLAVVHTDPGTPCEVGDDCTIGHGAIIGDESLLDGSTP